MDFFLLAGLLKIRVDDEVRLYVDGKVVYDEFAMRGRQQGGLAVIPYGGDPRIFAFRMYSRVRKTLNDDAILC